MIINGRLSGAGSEALWGHKLLQIGKMRFRSFEGEVAFPHSSVWFGSLFPTNIKTDCPKLFVERTQVKSLKV